MDEDDLMKSYYEPKPAQFEEYEDIPDERRVSPGDTVNIIPSEAAEGGLELTDVAEESSWMGIGLGLGGSVVFGGLIASVWCFVDGFCGLAPPTPSPTVNTTPIGNSICTTHYSCVASSAGQPNTKFCQNNTPTATENTCSSCALCNGTNGVSSNDGTGSCGYCGTTRPMRTQVEMEPSNANSTSSVFANITACFGSNTPWSSMNIPQAPMSVLANSSKVNVSILVYRPVSIEQRWGKYKAYRWLNVPAASEPYAYNTTFTVQPYDCVKVMRA
jgi:hypothetical protein